jgi:dGTPase
LTHSIEVAQISKGIAEEINSYHPYFLKNPINTDLVETVALAHDLGHPPFGHNGEKALDDMMKCYGGFEGNAQTLRILSRLEKKATIDGDFIPVKNGEDRRCGLNLSFRTLAGVLKYDKEIPIIRNPKDKLVKGYYYTEKEIVQKIRENVIINGSSEKLKTIECKIMDIADDIAYSTYDIEDAFKAEFLCPLGILSNDPEFIEKLSDKVSDSLEDIQVSPDEVRTILAKTYMEIFDEETMDELINTAV